MGKIPPWADLPAFRARTKARWFETVPIALRVGGLYLAKFEITRTRLRHVAPLTEVDLAEFKFARNYAAGGAAGYLASRYSTVRARGSHLDTLFAELFASWSSFLIAGDAAMDSKSMDQVKSQQFLSRLYLELYPEENRRLTVGQAQIVQHFETVFKREFPSAPLEELPETMHFRLELFAIHMARRFADVLRRLYRWHDRHGLRAAFSAGMRDFYLKAADLASGQLLSVQQRDLDEQHDWEWYRVLIELKTTNILFAILHLFVQERGGEMSGQAMARYFVAINSLFFHRQVLDDLLDFDEDLGRGQANSLIYMLISQARIARHARNRLGHNEAELRREIIRASMVWSDLDLQTCPLELALSSALANTKVDEGRPLDELVDVSLRRGEVLRDAWPRLDYGKIARIVTDSAIADRILSWIESGRLKDRVNAELEVIQQEPILDVIYFAFDRTVRTFQRCRARWGPSPTYRGFPLRAAERANGETVGASTLEKSV